MGHAYRCRHGNVADTDLHQPPSPCGRREQDDLLRPDQFRVEDGRWLVYRIENQNCARWAVDLADPDEPDPPTRWRGPTTATSTWRPFLGRFSSACVEMVLSELLLGESDLGDNRGLDDAALEALESSYAPLGLPAYELWALPGGPSVRWFSGDDILLRDDCRHWLWVHARTTAGLEHARQVLPGEWLMQ
jgi:hypothetical protein